MSEPITKRGSNRATARLCCVRTVHTPPDCKKHLRNMCQSSLIHSASHPPTFLARLHEREYVE